ncbi:MAG: hypothetical protein PHT00_03555 [Candidatus Methanomethylophilus sp.]|nr:hypothetical protein [Methanomethylophilus sp.]MDD4222485.1 hypothetical protein [Methanomethylophilus sp.]
MLRLHKVVRISIHGNPAIRNDSNGQIADTTLTKKTVAEFHTYGCRTAVLMT